MNVTSIQSLEGNASARPESEQAGRGIGFEGLLRSELGASPSRESRAEPRNPGDSRAARSEAGALQRGPAASSSSAETAGSREIDESDGDEMSTGGSRTVEGEGARPERLPGEAVLLFESGERIGDPPASGDAAMDARLDEFEAATAASDPSPADASARQASGPADAAATSGASSGSAAAIASTAVGQAVVRSRADAGDSGAVLSSGSGDGVVRAASDANPARIVAEPGVASNEVRLPASTSAGVEAAAVDSAQEAESDTRARAESRGSALESGESDRARSRTEAFEARIAGRAANIAGGEAGRAASPGSLRSEGGAAAIDSRAPGVEAGREVLHGSDRHGARDREGGDGPPPDDRSIDPRLADEGSSDRLSARAGLDSSIGPGSVVPAAAPVDGATSAAAHVQALPAATVGATGLPVAEAPPAGAAPPPPPAADALAVQTEWLATRGGGSARLVLHPPELGEIAIRVTLREGSVDVVMIAHEAAAKAIAEEQSDRLAQAFSNRDLRMGSFEVRQAETRVASEADVEAQLGNPDARDGGRSGRDPNAAADDDGANRVGGTLRSLNERPAALPLQALTPPAERSVDLRI